MRKIICLFCLSFLSCLASGALAAQTALPNEQPSKTVIVPADQGIPLKILSEQMYGVELVCKDGLVHVKKKASSKVLLQGQTGEWQPVRCEKDLYFFDFQRKQ